MSRNSHALSTRDNILYNGQLAYDRGMLAIKDNAKDNFWKRLPIEKMQILEGEAAENKPKNTDFELAEAKATKAIQKHSMNIDGHERNYQIDEAYLMLGKARYYDQRFYPALEAFNYILYKYATSNKIFQAKIWREKVNMRLGNDAQVIKNITNLLSEKKREDKKKNGKKFKKQVIADANALLAASFLNMEQKDSAIVKLRIAEKYTKVNLERARYRFILGQLHQELGARDSALYYYQSVIKMNRKASRDLYIHAYAKKAQLFDYKNGDKDAFVKRYNKLVDNRENRPYKDVIYYEMGVFYDKQNDQELAKEFYNASLNMHSEDSYLTASNYKNLGNMYFKNTEYSIAAKYYDSTLVKLDPKTREHIHIKKLRKDLDEVIEFEYIAKYNDSILNVVAMSDNDRISYYENYIDKLKKSDENKRNQEENVVNNSNDINSNDAIPAAGGQTKRPSLAPPMGINTGNMANVFYFYNPATVAFGKIEFKKKFGNRALGGNWKSPSNKTANTGDNDIASDTTATDKIEDTKIVAQYTTPFYLNQLPKEQTEIDEIVKKRNSAYYQLGVIYKEKFKEYELASNKLEQLLTLNPEEKLILPTMYNLYKIYQITDSAKAEEMKARILSQYPDSRYAQIIGNVSSGSVSSNETPEEVYDKLYKQYDNEQFTEVLGQLEVLILQYAGEEIVPKLELLRANILGKLKGVEAYKNAMQFVADNYPTTEEGKNAQEILTNQIPLLEKIDFSFTEAKNWKILYKVGKIEDPNTKALEEKIKKFIVNKNAQIFSYSFDGYTEKENFLVINGLNSEGYAKDIAGIMKDDKVYKVIEPAIVISSENYKVVQIKKNLDAYLAAPKIVPAPVADPAVPAPVRPKDSQPIVPQQPGSPKQAPVKQEPIKQTTPQAMPAGTTPPAGKPKSPPKP